MPEFIPSLEAGLDARTALVLVAHGSSTDTRAGEAAIACADALRRRGLFGEVRSAFWKQSPRVTDAVESLSQPRIVIVPLLASEGYFCERLIPQALGFRGETDRDFARVRRKGAQTLRYCRPVGTHPRIREVILASAQHAVALRPFPRAPRPAETALFVAAHGTGKHGQSRRAAEDHVRAIRDRGEYGEVHAVFLEETPGIAACYDLTTLKNLVLVPLFIGEGPHVLEDLPVCLGETRERVQTRLAAGRPGWPNPGERQGKRVWLAASVGSRPELLEVILERVREDCGSDHLRTALGAMA